MDNVVLASQLGKPCTVLGWLNEGCEGYGTHMDTLTIHTVEYFIDTEM